MIRAAVATSLMTPFYDKISPHIPSSWESITLGLDSSDLSFERVYVQPLIFKNSPNSHAPWRDNSVDFYDSLLNMFSSLENILSFGCVNWKNIAKRLLQTTINKDSSTPRSYDSICIIGVQKSSPTAKDSQVTISDFYESLKILAATEEVLHMYTKDTIEDNIRSSLEQQGMMILRRGNSPSSSL